MSYTKFNPNTPPPPLMTSEPGSFAQRTMTTRIPAIIRQVLIDFDHKHPRVIKQALQDLHEEVKAGQPMRLLETDAPDGPSWAKAYQPYEGKSWHNAPWYFAEAFLYRHLLQASGFFGGKGDYWEGNDPFMPRKIAELQGHTPWRVLSLALSHAEDDSPGSFRALLHHDVWGNRVDLSYNEVAQGTGREIAIERESANLLVDDTEAVLAHLEQGRRRAEEQKGEGAQGHKSNTFSSLLPGSYKRSAAPLLNATSCIDFICDNTGTELLMDLALADFLLRFNWCRQITLYVKAHPTFVSDAVPKDVDITLTAIKEYPETDLAPFGRRLEHFQAEGRLAVQADLFWNSNRFFWEMPSPLHTRLAQARLIVIKGDANYRRLLGDSRWPTTVPVRDAIPYFPAPFVCLRTMKSDPVVGLKPGLAQALDKEDPEWRVNGKRGMIQAAL